jgi:hypothetical protein
MPIGCKNYLIIFATILALLASLYVGGTLFSPPARVVRNKKV